MRKKTQTCAPECFVYILGCHDKNGARTYVGWTLDLERRLTQHNTGRGARSTRGRSWILLYTEDCATRSEAMSREWYLKRDRIFRKKLMQRFLVKATAMRAKKKLTKKQARRSGPVS